MATQPTNEYDELKSKMAELKKLKDLEVIDEETYSKSVDKLMLNFKKSIK